MFGPPEFAKQALPDVSGATVELNTRQPSLAVPVGSEGEEEPAARDREVYHPRFAHCPLEPMRQKGWRVHAQAGIAWGNPLHAILTAQIVPSLAC